MFQIEPRLNSVGMEISLVMQPIDFIADLKRQLKMYRDYKLYLVR